MRLFRRLVRKIVNNPTVKGKIGENRISFDLELLNFFGNNGLSLRNLYVPMRNGKTTEIDLVYITSKGLFVIESKNFAGYIYGNENQKFWTSTLYAGRGFFGTDKVEKHKFYNPIWQNITHVNSLKNYIGNVNMFSFVVFGNDCEIKSMSYDPRDVCICQESSLRYNIREVCNQLPDTYGPAEISDIYNRLLPLTNADAATKTMHVQQIHDPVESTSMTCPKCGGKLILRTARKGNNAGNQFYGCSNYPGCRYIQNLR